MVNREIIGTNFESISVEIFLGCNLILTLNSHHHHGLVLMESFGWKCVFGVQGMDIQLVMLSFLKLIK
jgi:hypothetical protein